MPYHIKDSEVETIHEDIFSINTDIEVQQFFLEARKYIERNYNMSKGRAQQVLYRIEKVYDCHFIRKYDMEMRFSYIKEFDNTVTKSNGKKYTHYLYMLNRGYDLKQDSHTHDKHIGKIVKEKYGVKSNTKEYGLYYGREYRKMLKEKKKNVDLSNT